MYLIFEYKNGRMSMLHRWAPPRVVEVPPDPRYRCEECGHECTYAEMGGDNMWVELDGGLEDMWSNWICPRCHTWHTGLDPKGGWTPIETPTPE